MTSSAALVRITYEVYESLIRQYSLRDNFSLSLTAIDVKCIDNFVKFCIEKYGERAGIDFVASYTNYQFKYWNRLNTMYSKGYCPVSWIYGKKAINRWDEDEDKFKFFKNENTVMKKTKVNYSLNAEPVKGFIQSLNDVDEKERERYLNTNKGMAWCVMHTSLYNHKSTHCLECRYSKECKEMLILNMPNVAKLRGY